MTENAPAGYSTVQPWLVSRDTGRLLPPARTRRNDMKPQVDVVLTH